MLKKLIKVRGVGILARLDAESKAEWERITLVHARNGEGKSTLAAILRALSESSADILKGRATVGFEGQQEVSLRANDTTITFSDGKWSSDLRPIIVFDGRYVADNVHTGEVVTLDQRRRLCQVVLGEQGAALARKEADLEASIRELDAGSKVLRAAVEKHVTHGVAFGAFVNAPQIPDAEFARAAAEKALDVAKRSTTMQRRPLVVEVDPPSVPELESVLSKTLVGMTDDVLAAVELHLNTRMSTPDAEWLARGMELQSGHLCPWCAQDASSAEFVGTLRQYFSKLYADYQAELNDTLQQIEGSAFAPGVQKLEATVDANARVLAEWEPDLVLSLPRIDVARLTKACQSLQRIIDAALAQKRRTPHLPIPLPTGWQDATSELKEALASVAEYNLAIEKARYAIVDFLRSIEGATVEEREAELRRITASLDRHRPDASAACNALAESQKNRKDLVDAKNKVRADLDTYSNDVFPRSEKRVNELLKGFGATFRIGKLKPQYTGRVANAIYVIRIGKHAVAVGDSDSPDSTPSFKNTLSAGDRSALALAFFVWQVESTTGISAGIVVLDDPFTSQDEWRQNFTAITIASIAKCCAQVVVLSHSSRFLELVSQRAKPGKLPVAELGIDHTCATPKIRSVKFAELHADSYSRNIHALQSVDGDEGYDPLEVAKAIRPAIESTLKHRFPGRFLDQNLAAMIGGIEQCPEGDVLMDMRESVPLLRELNDYGTDHQHGADTGSSDSAVDPQEVRIAARKALKFVRGLPSTANELD